MNRFLISTIALAVTAVMLAAPIASAQSVDTDNAATKGIPVPALLPEIDTHAVTLGFIYRLPSPVYNLAGVAQSTTTATLTLNCDNAGIIISGPQSTSITLTPDQTSATSIDKRFSFGPLSISTTRNLPGLQQIPCNYSATVGPVAGQVPTAGVGSTDGGDGRFTVSSKFYSVVQAKVGTQIKQAGPQKEVPFEVNLDNFGNARTQISFEINERPGGDRWQAVVPDDLILDSPASGGAKTSDTATFTVTTPYKNGWNNEQGTYRLAMKTFAADDPTQEGVELFTNVLVRVRGVYVPSLEPFLMVGAVIGSALVARKLRE